MMRYTVTTTKQADRELARLWLHAADRAAVTAAQHQIDRDLAADPRRAGVEMSEGLWRIIRAPVKAFYEINDDDRFVRITCITRSD